MLIEQFQKVSYGTAVKDNSLQKIAKIICLFGSGQTRDASVVSFSLFLLILESVVSYWCWNELLILDFVCVCFGPILHKLFSCAVLKKSCVIQCNITLIPLGQYYTGQSPKLVPQNLKNNFFQDKFYSLKVHAYYFTVLIFFAT